MESPKRNNTLVSPPTVIIAIRLFGWRKAAPPPSQGPVPQNGEVESLLWLAKDNEYAAVQRGSGLRKIGNAEEFPVVMNWDYIMLVQRRMTQLGLLHPYLEALKEHNVEPTEYETSRLSFPTYVALTAELNQRLWAMVAVAEKARIL